MAGGASEVLEALRAAGPGRCSGEQLSSRLGVSRAQIWKHVGALRRRGYGIDGEPGGGYRLTAVPDRLYPEEIQRGLTTRWLAREIRHFDSTDSTNRVALELAREGAVHGCAVVAEEQTAGRGRLGRRFYSPPHQNLYTTLVLRPVLTTAEAPTLILAAGIAVAETVAATLGGDEAVEIKWPNDVLVGGLKTSGILMEMSAEATRVGFAVLGIGVNLNVAREQLPQEFRSRATSLSSHAGRRIDRLDFTRRLYGILEQVLDEHARAGFDVLRPRFESRFRMRGRAVKVLEMGGRELSGVVRGIAPDGALEVERSTGEISRVIAGDVTLAKDSRPEENPTA